MVRSPIFSHLVTTLEVVPRVSLEVVVTFILAAKRSGLGLHNGVLEPRVPRNHRILLQLAAINQKQLWSFRQTHLLHDLVDDVRGLTWVLWYLHDLLIQVFRLIIIDN